MGLFRRANKNLTIKNEEKNVVYSPVSGAVVSLEEVNDAVFSQKMMGDGIAVRPDNGEIYAPVSGKVTALFPTLHAIGIEGDDGEDVVIHIGIDTVEFGGRGFTSLISKDDHVKAGQLIMKVDLPLVSQKYDPTTMVCVENSKDYAMQKCTEPHVSAGETLLRLTRTEGRKCRSSRF